MENSENKLEPNEKEEKNKNVSQYDLDVQEIAKIFISALKENVMPWERGFNPIKTMPFNNPATGTVYRGINTLILAFNNMKNGYGDPRYMTFKNAKALGGNVRKGEKAVTGYNYQLKKKEITDKDGNVKLDKEGNILYHEYMMPLAFKVFNVEQLENINLPDINKENEKYDFTANERAENLLKESKANIETTLNCACPCYIPMLDKIQLPLRTQYKDSTEWYATALHELSHWTGHKSRLNRDLSGHGDIKTYAKEELRAEIGSSMLCSSLGVGVGISENNKAYVKSWIKQLEDNPREIVTACSDAQKISAFVMEFDPIYRKMMDDLKEPLVKDDRKFYVECSETSAKKYNFTNFNEIYKAYEVSVKEYNDLSKELKSDLLNEMVYATTDDIDACTPMKNEDKKELLESYEFKKKHSKKKVQTQKRTKKKSISL